LAADVFCLRVPAKNLEKASQLRIRWNRERYDETPLHYMWSIIGQCLQAMRLTDTEAGRRKGAGPGAGRRHG